MKRSRYYDDDDDEEEEERPTHRLMIRTRRTSEVMYSRRDSIDELIEAMEQEDERERVEREAYYRDLEEQADMRMHARYARQFYESEDELWDGIYAPTPLPQPRRWGSQGSSNRSQPLYSEVSQSDSTSRSQSFTPLSGVYPLRWTNSEDATLPNQLVVTQDIIDNLGVQEYVPTQVVTPDDDDDTASLTNPYLDIAREYARRAFEE